jgi:hypothetical protein
MRNRFLFASGLMLGVLLLVSNSVKADKYQYTYDTADSPRVNVTMDTGNNTSSVNTYAGAFAVTDITNPVGTLQAFCIDLWHISSSPFYATAVGMTGPSQLAGLLATGYTPTADLASQLSYLATVYTALSNGLGHSTTAYFDAIGAVQLAVWSLIDQKQTGPPAFVGFAYTLGNSGLNSDYQAIIQALGGTATGSSPYSASNVDGTHNGTLSGTPPKIEGVAIANYNAGLTYSGGVTLLLVNSNPGPQGPSSSQNLVVFNGSSVTESITTPEPSTMAIAGLGALGMIGYGWKRRKRA